MPNLGPFELIVILVIAVMLFGVGRLPEIGGAVGKTIREFRNNMGSKEKDAETLDAADEQHARLDGLAQAHFGKEKDAETLDAADGEVEEAAEEKLA